MEINSIEMSSTRRSVSSASSSRKFRLDEILARMEPTTQEETARFGPPVDYSFRDLQKITDLWKCEPREGPHTYIKLRLEIKDTEKEVKTKDGNPEQRNAEEKQYYKYCSKAIRVSNNSLVSFDNFNTGLEAVLEHPLSLEWIDLSFNDFTKISEVLLGYKNVKVLYLHANVIDDLKQVNKLAALPNLKTLTLHGNIIEGKKGYRQYVIATLPQLQYLDFSRITKADRDKANVWKKLKIMDSGAAKKAPKKAE